MRVLLRLGDAKLCHALLLDDRAERVLDALGRVGDFDVHAFLVLRHCREREIKPFDAREAVKLRIGEGMREFSRAVGAEIEEYDAVALLHARIAADDGRDDKFVRHLLRVRGFDSFLRRRLLHAVALGDGVIRLLDALPALVAIHGVVTSRDRRDLADADLTAFLFELGEIACRARRRYVAPVKEGMHIDL